MKSEKEYNIKPEKVIIYKDENNIEHVDFHFKGHVETFKMTEWGKYVDLCIDYNIFEECPDDMKYFDYYILKAHEYCYEIMLCLSERSKRHNYYSKTEKKNWTRKN